MSQPIIFKVKEVRTDTPNLKTYVFEHNLRAKPGQFIMVWMPGVDEVPMSVGWQTEKEFHVGIANAGDCTKAIAERVKAGDKLGIRGPYGTHFTIPEVELRAQSDAPSLRSGVAKKIIVIGGGYGTPPLLLLAKVAMEKGIHVTAILGARSADFLVYEKQFRDLGCEVMVSTDDGSKGHKGYCTEVLEEMLKKQDKVKDEEMADAIYTCGPEKMMHKIAMMAANYNMDCQVSLERYMKCGFGVCGQCCLDGSGLRVCKDGPVLDGKVALEHGEFGKYTRTGSGTVKPL